MKKKNRIFVCLMAVALMGAMTACSGSSSAAETTAAESAAAEAASEGASEAAEDATEAAETAVEVETEEETINETEEEIPADQIEADKTTVEAQLQLISDNVDMWNQDYDGFQYCVTDLDQNGRLEVIAAVNDDADTGLYTTAYIYQVSNDYTALKQLDYCMDEGESGPNLITDKVTAYITGSGDSAEYYYLFVDELDIDETESVVFQDTLNLHKGDTTVATIAMKVSLEDENGDSGQEFVDGEDNEITEEQYNNMAATLYGDQTKEFSLGWFELGDDPVTLLTASYETFAQ